MIEKCPICNDYIFNSQHKCQPCFYVWQENEDFEEVIDYNKHRVFAQYSESAAEKYAESDWEFPIDDNVFVIPVKDGNEIIEKYMDEKNEWLTDEGVSVLKEKSELYAVTSEIVRNFYANKVKKEQ